MGGRGEDGRGYIEVMSKRNRKIVTHVVLTDGTAHLECRECFRWHNIKIVNGADVSQDGPPMPKTVQAALEAASLAR